MADVLEMRSLRLYGNSALNYLNEWAQRTGNVGNYDQFEVQVQVDQGTGEQWGCVVAKSTDNAPDNDAPVEEKPATRRKAK